MNEAIIAGNWNELKGKIRVQWAKLTDQDLEELKGNMDLLTGKIQQAYGHGKDKAEQELKEFKNSIAASINKIATSVADKTDTSSEMKEVKNEIK